MTDVTLDPDVESGISVSETLMLNLFTPYQLTRELAELKEFTRVPADGLPMIILYARTNDVLACAAPCLDDVKQAIRQAGANEPDEVLAYRYPDVLAISDPLLELLETEDLS